jgi:DNA-binding NarL/FixJ family response regulator
MIQFDISVVLSIVAAVLLVVVVAKAITLQKANTLLSQQLTETSNSLEAIKKNLANLQENHKKLKQFQNTLDGAELSTRIQKSRTVSHGERSRSLPERYSYIHSLAGRGMSSDEIAAVLTISTHEARQLVTLAKIARGN